MNNDIHNLYILSSYTFDIVYVSKGDRNMNARIYNECWNEVVSLMTDEVREQVHFELAPCSNEDFLTRYLELEPDFENVLEIEF